MCDLTGSPRPGAVHSRMVHRRKNPSTGRGRRGALSQTGRVWGLCGEMGGQKWGPVCTSGEGSVLERNVWEALACAN